MSREYGPKKAVLNRIAYVAATWMLRSTSLRYVALQRVVKMSQRVVFFTTRINTRCTYYCFRKKRCKIIRVLRCTHLCSEDEEEEEYEVDVSLLDGLSDQLEAMLGPNSAPI